MDAEEIIGFTPVYLNGIGTSSEEDTLYSHTTADSSLFIEDVAWRTNTDVAINFIGIFDTVAAVTSFADGDYSVHNANNPADNHVRMVHPNV